MSNPSADRISDFRTTQLMIAGDFEAYHYRAPYFQSLDFHTHDFYELYLFLDGRVTYYIEDFAFNLMSGDLLAIAPGRMHRPVIEDEQAVYERMVLWLNAGYLRALADGADTLTDALDRISLQNGGRIRLAEEDLAFTRQLLAHLVASRDGDEARKLHQDALVTALLTQDCLLATGEQAMTGSPAAESAGDALIADVIRYIDAHLSEPLSLDDICAAFYISKFHLLRRFKTYTNATLYDYILSKRIGLARRLIREGATASAASEACGFCDYSSFYKCFTAKTGLTPSQFKTERR